VESYYVVFCDWLLSFNILKSENSKFNHVAYIRFSSFYGKLRFFSVHPVGKLHFVYPFIVGQMLCFCTFISATMAAVKYSEYVFK
jgi:hypothetical protein